MCDNDIIDNYTTVSSHTEDDLAQQWLKRYNCHVMDVKDMYRYWAVNVPKIYSHRLNTDCLNIVYDEQRARNVLLIPLERFITGVHSHETIFNKLAQIDDPPTLCGRVFKSGEPTYSCRDCGLDPTCVLCVDCFRNSVHKNHRYKMSTSLGGSGFCDCGDKEAWKSSPFCDIHIQGVSSEANDTSDALKRVPTELVGVVDRATLVIKAVLMYCFEMLTWNQNTKLPQHLQHNDEETDSNETFVTMLFNDEVHTYEQVITTLSRAIDCQQKEATDYATTIDREGRSIVKCSTFDICNGVKTMIEKITSRHNSKPLRVDVMYTDVVAHQTFATRLLTWLQQILGYCEAFRIIFAEILMNKDITEGDASNNSNVVLLERIMKADTQLWKSMRNQWHQLFITGLLMEARSKKEFAKIFTRNYGTLMKDFILDDHEHTVSITSLSVQLYTVPSLAHALIAEENAIVVLLKSFLTECGQHRNHDGKLAFERNHSAIIAFRRAQYILADLRYLLAVKPAEWSDDLRKNFLCGVTTLIDMLKWMQGMDAVVRQVGQHVEFEAEWETGINLQIKLAPIVASIIDWCSSDRSTLIKSLRHTLKVLTDFISNCPTTEWELSGYRATCLDYDVSSMPVTIHLPFTRLVAGLLLQLGKFDLNYNEPNFLVDKKPTPMQLMELPLRTQVMIAQFRAGMWRRNGYSLVNQIYFYHNVRLRDEMFDRDILMLQIAAARSDPNEYLIHVLNKFSLLFWAKDNYEGVNRKPEEDYVRQTISLVEEFLGLILILVSERYVPGVGKVTIEDKIKNEIIQWLSMEAMTHSELVKYLPKESHAYQTSIENIIKEVAVFRKPTPTSNTGKYELKAEFYKHFNPFFYHYTRQDQSCAEEVQIKRKKQNEEELICCPPPIPPDYAPQFAAITSLLECDVLLHVINIVLKRTCNLHAVSFSETQFEKVLHIIGVALHEQLKATIPDFDFANKCVSAGILSLLEECSNRPICSRIDIHKDLLKWVLRKFGEVLQKPNTNEIMDVKMEETANQLENQNVLKVKHERKRNAEVAAARRERIMAQMSAMQKNFIKEHAEFFKDSEGASGSDCLMDTTSIVTTSVDPISVGENQRGKTFVSEVHTCILCREEQEVTITGRCMVLSAFVQRSTVLSKNRDRKQWTDSENIDPLLISSDLYFGPHISTCGHVMHSDCWQKFFESVLAKEKRRPIRYGRHVSFDVDRNEFLCPLCECLSNSVIPIIPLLNKEIRKQDKRSNIPLSHWLLGLHAAVEKAQPQWIRDHSMNETGEKFVCRFMPQSLNEILTSVPFEAKEALESLFDEYKENVIKTEKISKSFVEVMKIFSQAIYSISLNIAPNLDDDRLSLVSYWSCAYTIHSIERILRLENKPIFGDLSSRKYNCLRALVRYIGSSVVVFNEAVIKSHCIRILRYLLVNDVHVSSSNCCLDIDPFSTLVSLIITTPSLYLFNSDDSSKFYSVPLGNVSDKNYILLLLVFHMVQIILTHKSDKYIDEPMDIETDSQNDGKSDLLLTFYSDVTIAAGLTPLNASPNVSQIEYFLKSNLLPFLRSTALYFHFLTNVSPPSRLKDKFELLHPNDEYNILCQYLGLPTNLSSLLECQSLRQLALNWCRHPRVNLLLSQNSDTDSTIVVEPPPKLIKQPHTVNYLIALPNDYSDLINSVSQFTCPNSDGDDSRSPTMCLVCGTILCSQSYCCQTELETTMVGACTNHTHCCGAGIGVFLRIRDCKILLLAGKTKGCYLAPPYIDEYGETDQGLVRGNPLHLCQSSYAELHRLWLRHGIPEQIAHALEVSSNLASTNWHLL